MALRMEPPPGWSRHRPHATQPLPQPPPPEGPHPSEGRWTGHRRRLQRHLEGDGHRHHHRSHRLCVVGLVERDLGALLRRAWLIVPLDSERANIFSRAINDRRGIRLVIATIPAFIVLQVIISVLHIGYLGFFSWPVFIAGAIGILIWRNASDPERLDRQRRDADAAVRREPSRVAARCSHRAGRRAGHRRHRHHRARPRQREGPAPGRRRAPAPRRRRGRARSVVAADPAAGPGRGAPSPRPGRRAGPDGGPRARLGAADAGPHSALGRRPAERGPLGPGPGTGTAGLALRGPPAGLAG